jgi:hypothetical protein
MHLMILTSLEVPAAADEMMTSHRSQANTESSECMDLRPLITTNASMNISMVLKLSKREMPMTEI